MILDPMLQHTAALTLALVFGAAAYGKFTAWDEFEGVVQNFRVLPRALVPVVAKVLPPLEAIAAVAILVPALRAEAGSVMAVLLAAFAAGIAINLARGRVDIDCGCFRSSLKQNLSAWLVLRNVLLVVLAVACIASPAGRELGAADLFFALMGAAVLFLVYLSVGYVTLRRPPTFEENYQRSLAGRG